jgi:hypothetical protein
LFYYTSAKRRCRCSECKTQLNLAADRRKPKRKDPKTSRRALQ